MSILELLFDGIFKIIITKLGNKTGRIIADMHSKKVKESMHAHSLFAL